MRGIPKIVLERLKGRTVVSDANRQSGADNPQFQHPDANLLAAFLEQTLTERERTQVLSHLAECAECREIAALTLPTEAEAAEPARSPVGKGWSVRPILRWGALAAALSAVVLVAVLRQHSRSRVQTASNTAPPAIMAKASEAAPQAQQPRPAQPTTTAAKRRAQPKALESASEIAKLQEPAPTPLTKRLSALTRGVVRRTLTPPRAQLRPTAATPAFPLSAPSAEISAGPNTELIHAAAQPNAAVEHPPVPNYDKRSLAGAASALTPMRAKALQPRLSANAFRSPLQGTAAHPGALWSISPEGKLQRSEDGGKNWEEVGVDDNVEFRVIQADGREIWAGGTGGALYHSSDGGASWTRVNPASGATPATEVIVSISCSSSDLQQITVKTASGTQWVSHDGGQHWRAVTSDE